MDCSTCGASNPEGSERCGSCGARLAVSPSMGGHAASPLPPTLHAMGVGDIIDETIRLFRQNFRTFIGIVAVLQIPLLVVQLAQLAIAGPRLLDPSSMVRGDEIQAGWFVFWIGSAFVLGLVGTIAFIAIEAALSSAIAERYLGRQATVRGAYRVARSSFWRLAGAMLLGGVALVLMFITIIGIPFFVYWSVRWALIVQTIVLEGAGVTKSLSRSSALVKGNWWRALGVFLVAVFAQYLVASIPGSIVGVVLGAVAALVSPEAVFAATIANTVINAVFQILAMPLIPIVSTLLYYDLRIRKEGFDLQLMVERLNQGQLPAVER